MIQDTGWHSFMLSNGHKTKVTRALLSRVLGYARPFKWQICGMLLAILSCTGLNLLSPLIFRKMIDEVLPSKDLDNLVRLAIALLLVTIISGVISVFQMRITAIVGQGVIYNLRAALFAGMQRMSLRFFTNTKSGEMMSRINNDVLGAQNAISNTTVNLITGIIKIIALAAIMLALEWHLTIVSLIIFPLLIFAVQRMGAILRNVTREAMEIIGQMNSHMQETLNISGALLVKLFGRTCEEDTRFCEHAAKVRDNGIRAAMIGSVFFVILALISAVGTAIVYSLGGYLVIKNRFTIGTIVAFSAYLTQLYETIQGLANAPVILATSMVSFERVFEVLDMPKEISEKPAAFSLADIKGDLVFENVFFKYDMNGGNLFNLLLTQQPEGRDRGQSSLQDPQKVNISFQPREIALVDISFHAKPGELIALVGPSGAGKTTITYLIPRLYDPTGGTIRIDGWDLRDLTLSSLSSSIGMVTQECHLFHDTIRTNLQYSKMNATQAEIEDAAKIANIHQFIMDLPDRYETIVGEHGYRLSGGEKQRIALARAILKNPRILVLDEATSHLDNESELLIQEALKRVMAGRTSIVVAHRLSTVRAADRILVLSGGRIVDCGTHDELLTKGGLYVQLYESKNNPIQRTAMIPQGIEAATDILQ
jgi:ATP-binding cassette subfamily B protein